MLRRTSSVERVRVAFVAFALLVASGCDACSPRGARDAGTTGAGSAPAREANVGTVVGVVKLAPGAIVPRFSVEQVGRSAELPGTSPNCPPARDTDTLPVRGSGDPAGLAGVAVYATGPSAEAFAAALPPSSPVERRVAIRECRLEPRIVVATVGDALVIANESRDAFFPPAGPTGFLESVMPGASRRVELDHVDAAQVTCGFSLACGRADVIVMRYPVHSVSTEAGRFELRNVPAGQAVKIHAWHPLFREATVETRVARGGRVTVELVLSPVSEQARLGEANRPRPLPPSRGTDATGDIVPPSVAPR